MNNDSYRLSSSLLSPLLLQASLLFFLIIHISEVREWVREASSGAGEMTLASIDKDEKIWDRQNANKLYAV